MTNLTSTNESRLQPIIGSIAKKNNLEFSSILDVGSSDRPQKNWFDRFPHSVAPREYIALEVDPVMVERLREKGLSVATSFSEIELPFDLTIATEVIEHIRAEDSVEFLINCRERTKTLFGLTTPNFEYWRRFRPLPEYKECRWIPDHAPALRPGSKNSHDHQQEMTPEVLSAYMEKAFPPGEWDVVIYRAWPWILKDVARNTSFDMYFKLFATALRLK